MHMARTRLYRLNWVDLHSPCQATFRPPTVLDTGSRGGQWCRGGSPARLLRESGRELRAGLAEGRGHWALGQKTKGDSQAKVGPCLEEEEESGL